MTRLGSILLLVLFCGAASAAGAVGDLLPVLELKDARDQPRAVDDTIRRIYLSVDRRGGTLVREAMAQDGATLLSAQRAVTIAEISEAPGFVKRLIRSGLADRPYPTLIDAAGLTRELLPRREDQVTIVDLQQRRITALRFVGEAPALRQALLEPMP